MRELGNNNNFPLFPQPPVPSASKPERRSNHSAPSSVARIFARVQHSPSESLILQTIADLANVTGHNARISFEALAASIGHSRRWTRVLVERLEERHLLRVHRRRISYSHCAINVYDIVCPWRRDLTYKEALAAKQARAQMSRDLGHARHPNERKRLLADALTEEKIRKNQGCAHPTEARRTVGPDLQVCTQCWISFRPPAEDTQMAI